MEVIDVSKLSKEKWVRSPDGWVAGVFEGLGRSFDIEPNILRILWLISVFCFGSGILIYLILAFTLPRRDYLEHYQEPKMLGTCLRLHQRTGIELGLIRFIGVLSLFISFGLVLVLYLGLYFFLPEPKEKIYF